MVAIAYVKRLFSRSCAGLTRASIERKLLETMNCRSPAEHELECPMKWLMLLAALTVASPAFADAEANKKAVLEFYEAGLNRKDFDAASKYFGPKYIQHNPGAPDGIEGFRTFLNFLREKFPIRTSEIKEVLRRGRLRDPARACGARARHARPRHRRYLPARERQDRGALGRRAGHPGKDAAQ